MAVRTYIQDGEIAALHRELLERLNGYGRSASRRNLRLFTIAASYTVKRIFDFAVSLVLLLALLPLFAVIALAIKATSPGPVIFTQARTGRFGRQFRFYKFRSMYCDAEKRKGELLAQNQSADGVIFKMKHDPRITPVGRILRRTSMDELPQLFNVLAGDMSLVGPRPPLPSEVKEYTLEDRKRLNVIPGLTCLWQISGRSDIPFQKQVELDKEYIRSRSMLQDIWILVKTVPAIFTGRGAY